MLTINSSNKEKVQVTAFPIDEKDQAKPLDGPLTVTVVDGPATVVMIDDLSFFAVSSDDLEDHTSTISVSGTSQGKTITDTVTYLVTAVPVVPVLASLGLVAAAPVLK